MARKHLGGELTAFEVMWNEYYRLALERVNGAARPLPIDYPFYFLIEASGDDAHRVHADLEKLLDTATRANMIVDATLSMSNASTAAIWRIRDCSLELARSFPYTARFALDVSIDINRMDQYVKTIVARITEIDPGAFAMRFRSRRRWQPAYRATSRAHARQAAGIRGGLVSDHQRIQRINLSGTRHRHS